MKRLFNRVYVELLLLQEFYFYSARHPRYLVIALYLYLPSLFFVPRLGLFRLGFCMLQYLDDLADGDRKTNQDVREILEDAQKQLMATSFSANRFGVLALAFFNKANKAKLHIPELKSKFALLIGLLKIDYERRLNGGLMTEAELKNHLNQTFSASIDLAMLILGSSIQSNKTLNLVKAFGICSLIRDLEEDLERGIINLPSELQKHKQNLNEVNTLLESKAIRIWLIDLFEEGKQAIEACSLELEVLQKEKGYRMLRIFDKSMQRFFSKPEKFYFLKLTK